MSNQSWKLQSATFVWSKAPDFVTILATDLSVMLLKVGYIEPSMYLAHCLRSVSCISHFRLSYRPDVQFHHEDMSKQMLEYLIDENAIDIDREDVRFIQELIEGQPSKKNEDRRWMYEIVANNRNSVDVDKFDYLARDCYNLGIKSSYDFSRLMKFSRVINNEICFHSKEVYNMYEMFHTRYSLFKQVYSHRVGKAIEYMVSDALLYADPYLKISERVRSPESYCYLTDSILTQIEGSTQPELKQSRDIIKRMRRRELYKMADEIIVPSHKLSTFPQVTVEGILEYKPADVDLKADDMIVDMFSCNYGA